MKKPTAKEYRVALLNLLECHTPRSFPCGKCKWPVLDGFVCSYCKDTMPAHDAKGNDVRDWK